MFRWVLSSILALGITVGAPTLNAEAKPGKGKATATKKDDTTAKKKGKKKGKKGKKKGKKGNKANKGDKANKKKAAAG